MLSSQVPNLSLAHKCPPLALQLADGQESTESINRLGTAQEFCLACSTGSYILIKR